MKEKARNILTFHGNSFSSFKIAKIFPFPAFLGELTSFLLISMFSSNNKQKTLNIATIYFFLKKIINDVFFNVFMSINGILNKTQNKQNTEQQNTEKH